MKQSITLSQLAHDLDALLDSLKVKDHAINGVQIANTGPISKIATAVTADLASIEKALALGVQALIVHHGVLKNEPYRITGTLYQKIKKLMDNNIALLCYHLPLDAHRDLGNNWKAAHDLGWQHLEPFGEYNGILIGVRGTFEPVLFSDFVSKLEAYYGNKATTVAIKKEIACAALISGGAYKYITQAAQAGVDCFITGNFDEPAWYSAHEEHISFCALGHAATEKVGPKALAAYIEKTYGVESIFIDTQNPF